MSWKEFGIRHGLAEVLFLNFAGGTEEKLENPPSEELCPNKDLNQEPAKYKSRALQPCQVILPKFWS
jgi:hypothetical protein